MPKYKIEILVEVDDVSKLFMSIMNAMPDKSNWKKQSIHMELYQEDAEPVAGKPVGQQVSLDSGGVATPEGRKLTNTTISPDQWVVWAQKVHPGTASNLWNSGHMHPAQDGVYERCFTDGIYLQKYERGQWWALSSLTWRIHHRQVGEYPAWRNIVSIAHLGEMTPKTFNYCLAVFASMKYGGGWITSETNPPSVGWYDLGGVNEVLKAFWDGVKWCRHKCDDRSAFVRPNGVFPAWRIPNADVAHHGV